MIGEHVRLTLALKAIPQVGDKKIINYFKEADRQVSYHYDQVIQTAAVSNIRNLTTDQWGQCLKTADAEIAKANEYGIHIISYLDDEYPLNLRVLPTAPTILYVKGNYKILNVEKSVAVIGTRQPTDYGIKIDQLFAKTLSLDGFVVVSGLAIGCDTYAHRGALDGSGKTVAILAHGLDQPAYPKSNRAMADDIIAKGGALMSTYPIGTKLRPQFLAARDQWQSGMSDGVLVIETGIQGGTRIAMKHSVKQERPLAVIDYRQRNEGRMGDKALEINNFQGNYDAIQHENAHPVFTRDELAQFEQLMIKGHQERAQDAVPHFVQTDLL